MGLHNDMARGVAGAHSPVLAILRHVPLSLAMLLALVGVVMAAEPASDLRTDDPQPREQHTWRLSVINGGQPRGEGLPQAAVEGDKGERHDPFADQQTLASGKWLFFDGLAARFDGQLPTLGRRGAIPFAGDFNGDGQADIGVFVDGQWFIDLDGNGRWDDGDLWAKLGEAGDQPVVGDWDGDGKTDIGVWGAAWRGDNARIAAETGLPDADNASRTKPTNAADRSGSAPGGVRLLQRTSQGAVRADAVDHVFQFGLPDGVAVAGDFNGDGIDTIGVFCRGRWLLDAHGDGKSSAEETEFVYGAEGDVPVVGDFNGDGIDEIGIFRNGTWHIDTNGNHVLDEGDAELRLGDGRDSPVTGDFDGDGTEQIGVYRGEASAQ